MGNIKPESSMFGTMKNCAIIIACCWVAAKVEIKTPSPKLVKMKTPERANRSPSEPLSGTPNQKIPRSKIKTMLIKPMTTNGKTLAKTNSHERTGVTESCSAVPRSFSLTIEMPVKFMVEVIKITQSIPGTMKLTLFNSGLYQTLTCGSTRMVSCVRIPMRCSRAKSKSTPAEATMAEAYPCAIPATLELVASTKT